MTTTEQPKKKRSVSQINQYNRCPHSYYLARIERAWKRPAAWLPQGTAVHAVAEIWRRRQLAGDPMTADEARDLFREEYSKEVGQYCAITPNFEWWFRSGPYDGETDVQRRYQIGLEQVDKFIAWTESHPEEVIWIAPDGTPGIEQRFDIDLDGVPVTGFIDAIIVIDGQLRVRDYKTGNSPGDDFQLGVYGVAVAEMFGVEPPQIGEYYMAGKQGKKAVLTAPFPIGEWTTDRVAEKFRELENNLQAERFDATPDPDKCNFCDVAYSCKYRAE